MCFSQTGICPFSPLVSLWPKNLNDNLGSPLTFQKPQFVWPQKRISCCLIMFYPFSEVQNVVWIMCFIMFFFQLQSIHPWFHPQLDGYHKILYVVLWKITRNNMFLWTIKDWPCLYHVFFFSLKKVYRAPRFFGPLTSAQGLVALTEVRVMTRKCPRNWKCRYLCPWKRSGRRRLDGGCWFGAGWTCRNLVMTHVANWKDPPFFWGKSTIDGHVPWVFINNNKLYSWLGIVDCSIWIVQFWKFRSLFWGWNVDRKTNMEFINKLRETRATNRQHVWFRATTTKMDINEHDISLKYDMVNWTCLLFSWASITESNETNCQQPRDCFQSFWIIINKV